MVSRANLSGRPRAGGVLNRVMNPIRQRNKARVAAPADLAEAPAGVPAMAKGAALAQATASAKQQALEQANRAVKPQAEPNVPIAPPIAPPPTARRQAMQTQQATARARGTAMRQRAGLDRMGATQEEEAPSSVAQVMAGANPERTGLPARRLNAQQQAADQRGVLERTGEAGGTRTETPVTEPTLNRSRRPRSRAGRYFR